MWTKRSTKNLNWNTEWGEGKNEQMVVWQKNSKDVLFEGKEEKRARTRMDREETTSCEV